MLKASDIDPADWEEFIRGLEEAEFVAPAPWECFLCWFHDAWQPGQHVALIGPTGQGKTTFAAGILSERKYVVALDAKGGDDTLAASGFRKLTSWPPPSEIRDEIAEGKPARLIITGSTRTQSDMNRLIGNMRAAVEGVRAEGGWTIYADEFQILGDRRMFDLGPEVEKLLISARSAGTSVVSSFQAPAWVPKAGTRQATYVVMLKTQARDMIKVVAEATGRDWHDLADALDRVPKFFVLVMPQDVYAPMVITHAPKIN